MRLSLTSKMGAKGAVVILAGALMLLPGISQAQHISQAQQGKQLRGQQGEQQGEMTPPSAVENRGQMETALVLGPGKTAKDARKTFEKEARQGYAPAQVNLAVFYLNGWGVEKNYGAALYWLKEAAKQGQPKAYVNLGLVYLNGWGVAPNFEEALKNFRDAAEHGETGAMINVGYMTETGMGTAQDAAAAAEWYRRAADRGDALGQNNLADLYMRGLGVPQNDAEAAEWFQRAAEKGQTGARIKLGFLFMTGRGVTKDPVRAYEWIQAASLAGDHRGDGYLKELSGQMDAEQLEAATKRARELPAARLASPQETAFVR